MHPIVVSTAKILIAGGVIAWLAWQFPIVELAYIVTYIFLPPILILVAIGIISTESLNLLLEGSATFREKVDAYRAEFAKQHASEYVN